MKERRDEEEKTQPPVLVWIQTSGPHRPRCHHFSYHHCPYCLRAINKQCWCPHFHSSQSFQTGCRDLVVHWVMCLYVLYTHSNVSKLIKNRSKVGVFLWSYGRLKAVLSYFNNLLKRVYEAWVQILRFWVWKVEEQCSTFPIKALLPQTRIKN